MTRLPLRTHGGGRLTTTMHRPLMWLTGIMAVLAVVSTFGLFFDERTLTGAPIWAKPLKFALSIMIYSLTLAWLLRLLPRWRRVAWWIGTVTSAFLLVEMVIIVGAVWAGTTSHFNVSTPLAAALWTVMAASIAVVWSASLVVALLLFRADLGDPARSVAIRAGTVIGVIGMGLAYLMTAPTPDQLTDYQGIVGAHTVGVADGGPGLPILGWSTVGGDLRIPHFVGMHALQLIPLAAMLLEFGARHIPVLRDPSVRARIVWIIVALYAGVLALLTYQAIAGQSIVSPDLFVSSIAATLFVAAGIAATFVLRAGSSRPRSRSQGT